MYNVIIAERQEITRTGIKHLVNEQPFFQTIVDVDNTIDLMLEIDKGEAGLIITGLDMPGENTILSIRQIHKSYPHLPILVLSNHDEIECVKQCFLFGASGYVLKNSQNSEIVTAMKKVMFQDQYIDPSLPVSKMDLMTSFCYPHQQSYDKLSRREREVFPLAVLGYGNKEIARRLCISTKTVEAHKTHMMQKLSLTHHADLIQYAAKNHLVNF